MPTAGSRSDSGLFARPGPVKPRSSSASGVRVSTSWLCRHFHHCRGEDHPEPGPRRCHYRSADRLSAPVGHRQPACLGLLPGCRIRRDRPGRNCVRHPSAHLPRPNPKLTPTLLAHHGRRVRPLGRTELRTPEGSRLHWDSLALKRPCGSVGRETLSSSKAGVSPRRHSECECRVRRRRRAPRAPPGMRGCGMPRLRHRRYRSG